MIPNRLRALHGEELTPKSSQITQGYRVTLSRPGGLLRLGIRGYSSSEALSNGVRKTDYLGNKNAEGRYDFPISFHGKCFLDGDMLAAAMLKAAETNSALSVSISGRTLTFSCSTTIPLLPKGFLRDGSSTVYTVMFRMRAPDFSGSSLRSGFSFAYDTGNQIISQSGTFTGVETVQYRMTSATSRRVEGFCVSGTSGKTRELDLDSFGIFFGTPTLEEYEPYHGEEFLFSLAGPLRTKDGAADIAYPLQGYAERRVLARPFLPQSATVVDMGSSYPTYRVELPEDLQDKNLNLNCFTVTTDATVFTQFAMCAIRSEDGKAFLFTASAKVTTTEGFLALFPSLEAELLWLADAPVTEYFTPIRPSLAAEEVFISLQTVIRPYTMYFTYL